MPQIFRRSADTLIRLVLGGVVVAALGSWWLFSMINHSSYVTEAGVVRPQPVPFSHKHHVSGVGIDCRFCHTGAETSSFAGLPPTSTCMTCHSQVWADAPVLAPVRESERSGRPIAWTRVNDLPDFVYFDHSIHVSKGVACVTCHGPVGEMPLPWRENSLQMGWCLQCHRQPEKFIGARSDVFNPAFPVRQRDPEKQARLIRDYHVNSMTNCSTCHR